MMTKRETTSGPATPARTLRVAATQMECAAGDKVANFATMERLLAEAARQSVKLIAFPECCITGYWFLRNLDERSLRALAEPVPDGESTQRLIRLSRQHGMTIGAGLVEAGDDGALFNTYVVAMPSGETRRHRKIQAFEHALIHSGSEHTVFELPEGVRVGVLICYDNNVNENGRISALKGAEIMLAPHQTGGCRTRDPNVMGVVDRRLWDERRAHPEAIEREFAGEKGRAWLMRWLPSRAHDNGVFLVFANGVGVDDDEVRTGNAMVLDPYGRVMAEIVKADDGMVVVDVDLAIAQRSTGRRWIAARRPELYAQLAQRTGLERDTRALKFLE